MLVPSVQKGKIVVEQARARSPGPAGLLKLFAKRPGQWHDIYSQHLMDSPMRPLLALLLPLPFAALASPGIDAFAQRCEREMKPVIDVRARAAPITVHRTVSGKVLSTRSAYANASQQMLGMTSGKTRTEILFDGPGLLDPAGERECVAPRILVDLSYHPLDVYVAREFNQYSCPYREIYAHEMRHVALYRESLPLLERKLGQVLAERYGDRPLYARPGQGLARLEHDVDYWLRPLIKEELARLEQLQRNLDTPEETFRLSYACSGEVASIMGRAF
jgi:hypothetical protein